MNALAHDHDFSIVSAPVTEWLVLRCSSSKTLALAAALSDRGAWTPTWKRKRRLPRSPISRVITEAVMPSFVFVPASEQYTLPNIARCPARFMQNADWTLIRIPDRQMEPLRKIADKPMVKARDLPRVGSRVKFNETSPFYGWEGKVLSCTQRCVFVAVPGFAQPIQAPPLHVA